MKFYQKHTHLYAGAYSMKQSLLYSSIFFLLANNHSLLFSGGEGDQVKERPRTLSEADREMAAATLQAIKEAAKSAKSTDKITNTFIVALEQEQKEWDSIFSYAIDSDKHAKKKFTILAALLLPKVKGLKDVTLSIKFIEKFSNFFGQKAGLSQQDQAIHILLDQLEKQLEENINQSFGKHVDIILKQDPKEWPLVFSNTFNQYPEAIKRVSLKILAQALLPKIQDFPDIMMLRTFMHGYAQALGPKTSANNDLVTFSALEALKKKEDEFKKAHTNSMSGLLGRKSGKSPNQEAKSTPPPVPARNDVVDSAAVSKPAAKPPLPKRTTSLKQLKDSGPSTQKQASAQAQETAKQSIDLTTPAKKAAATDTPQPTNVKSKSESKAKEANEAEAELKANQEADRISVNKDYKFGTTELHSAAMEGRSDIVMQLLAANADVNIQDTNGNTPLQLAAFAGHVEAVKLLIVANARVNIKNNIEMTALQSASQRGHSEVVKLLIKANAEVNANDNKGHTPLHEAAAEGHAEVVKLLIEVHAEVNAKNKEGRTPLHWASASGSTEVVKLLIQANAEVNAQDEWGWTALHWAAVEGCTQAAKLLVEAQADVHAKDSDGATPLHFAVFFKHKDVAMILTAAKADVNAKENRGLSVMDFAIHNTENALLIHLWQAQSAISAF